jgi:hypothetical protein
LYRITYLLKLVGAQNKIRLVMTLLLNMLFERDITAEYVRTGRCRDER